MTSRRNVIEEPEVAAVEPTEEEKAKDAKREKSSISVSMPPAMKALVEERAASEKVPARTWLRGQIATLVGFTGPLVAERAVRTKYATEAERKAAQKERTAKKRELFKALLAKYEKDPSILE